MQRSTWIADPCSFNEQEPGSGHGGATETGRLRDQLGAVRKPYARVFGRVVRRSPGPVERLLWGGPSPHGQIGDTFKLLETLKAMGALQ